jgi:hypothetical protein
MNVSADSALVQWNVAPQPIAEKQTMIVVV